MDDGNTSQMYRVPGEYFYKGVLFSQDIRKSVMVSRDEIECRGDDVFVASLPKSGTTWVLEITNLVMHPELLDSNCSVGQECRIPFLEFYNEECGVDHVENMKNLKSPRLIKTHLPEQLFPSQAFEKKSKIIYIARNPKDNAVSMYHFYRSTACYGYYKGSWECFVDMYLKGHIVYGSWFDHVLGWWKHSHQPNVLYLKYEDVKKNYRGTIEQIAKHLGRELSSETIDKIMEHCAFDSMKGNPAVNRINAPDVDSSISPFMRKGIIGDWKNYFTVAQSEELDKLYNDRLENSGLTFEW